MVGRGPSNASHLQSKQQTSGRMKGKIGFGKKGRFCLFLKSEKQHKHLADQKMGQEGHHVGEFFKMPSAYILFSSSSASFA